MKNVEDFVCSQSKTKKNNYKFKSFTPGTKIPNKKKSKQQIHLGVVKNQFENYLRLCASSLRTHSPVHF